LTWLAAALRQGLSATRSARAIADSSHVRALKRGPTTGPSPVDRGRAGFEHHVLTDATGIPLAITAYNPPRQLEIRGHLGPFPSRLSYALDANPEGTHVTNSVELELRGPGRLLGRVAVPHVRDDVAANL
jgi:hypothetical protein